MSLKYGFQNICSLIDNHQLNTFVLSLKNEKKIPKNYSRYALIVEKVFVQDKYSMRIRFHESNKLDVINTKAMLMTSEKYCNFRKWVIKSNNYGFTLTIPVDDFRRVQKGFSTEMMIINKAYKIKQYRENPSFPWISRCLADLDDVIFFKGIRCLYYLLTNVLLPEVDHLMIRRLRLLPKLLQKFCWRSTALENPDFLRSLLSFMTPGDQTLLVSPTVTAKMNLLGCPLPCHRKFKATVHEIDQYYRWLVSQDDVFDIFLNIYNTKDIRQSKKRKEHKPDKSTMVAYRSVTCQGHKKHISTDNKRLECNLLDICYFVCMRDCVKSNWLEFIDCSMYKIMRNIVENGVLSSFSPIVSLPNKPGPVDLSNETIYRQMDVFPLFMVSSEIKSKIKELKIKY